MTLLESTDNFFVTAWEAIVNFFTVTLPDFFMDPAGNWPWFILVGGCVIVFVVLIVLLIRAGKKRRRKKREKREAARLAAEEQKVQEDEAAELERIRKQREAEVRASGLSIDELIYNRAAEERAAQELELEEQEKKLQAAFAAESTDEPAPVPEGISEDESFSAFISSEAAIVKTNEDAEEKITGKPAVDRQVTEDSAAQLESLKESAPVKPSAKKATAAKKEAKPIETVMYSIIYDRAEREWVVRKTGSPRAIRRLRTKSEALEYAEQLSVRQGLALQVHKKDGKFQKKN